MATILLVDDNPSIRTLNKIILETAEYDVLVASDGFEAVELASDNDVDVVILDINMPLVNGFEVLEVLQPLAEAFECVGHGAVSPG